MTTNYFPQLEQIHKKKFRQTMEKIFMSHTWTIAKKRVHLHIFAKNIFGSHFRSIKLTTALKAMAIGTARRALTIQIMMIITLVQYLLVWLFKGNIIARNLKLFSFIFYISFLKTKEVYCCYILRKYLVELEGFSGCSKSLQIMSKVRCSWQSFLSELN